MFGTHADSSKSLDGRRAGHSRGEQPARFEKGKAGEGANPGEKRRDRHQGAISEGVNEVEPGRVVGLQETRRLGGAVVASLQKPERARSRQ